MPEDFDLSFLTAEYLVNEKCELEWIVEENPIFYFQSTTADQVRQLAEKVRVIQQERPELWNAEVAGSWIYCALLFGNPTAANVLREELLPNDDRSWGEWYWEMFENNQTLDWIPTQLALALAQANEFIDHPDLHYSPMIIGYKWDALGFEGDSHQVAETLFILGESFNSLASKTAEFLVTPEQSELERFIEGFVYWAESQSDDNPVRSEFWGISLLCGTEVLSLVRERLSEFWGEYEYVANRLSEALQAVIVLGQGLELPESYWRPVAQQICRWAIERGEKDKQACERVLKRLISYQMTITRFIED